MSESVSQIKLPLHVFIIHKEDFPFSCCFLMHLLSTTKEAHDYIFLVSNSSITEKSQFPLVNLHSSHILCPSPVQSIPFPRRSSIIGLGCLQTSYVLTDVYNYIGEHNALCIF